MAASSARHGNANEGFWDDDAYQAVLDPEAHERDQL
jgi:hypothetical protein